MLIQTYQLTDKQVVFETRQVSTFEAAELNGWPGAPYSHSTRWQGDTELFSLVAQDTVKIGQPVNRNDADYWIEQVARLGAMGEGERVGRVKVR